MELFKHQKGPQFKMLLFLIILVLKNIQEINFLIKEGKDKVLSRILEI